MTDLTGRQKKTLFRIVLSAALLVAAVLIPVGGPWRAALFTLPYLVIGYDVLFGAVRNILHGQVFDERFLMALATVGAFAVAEYAEAVFVMLFYQVGELFQSVAVGKSRRSIAALMDIRPDEASVEREGDVVTVDPADIAVGDVIVVRPGEKVPLDGVILEGSAALDTRALTGESVPRDVTAGDAVFSGCVDLTGLLRIRVTKDFGESTVSKVLDLVENATERKARSERFITRFAAWYTPAVVGGALLLFLIPSLITGAWAAWLHRALIFLVVSCPCALVISVPLTYFGSIGGASRRGILIKGADCLEALADCGTVCFDKTGTLTRGEFSVVDVSAYTVGRDELLRLSSAAESVSDHPVSRAFRTFFDGSPEKGPEKRYEVSDVNEIPGKGICAVVGGLRVGVGNRRLMEELVPGVTVERSDGAVAGIPVYVAVDGEFAGVIYVADTVRPEAADALRELKRSGVPRTLMLSGDREEEAARVASQAGVGEYRAELLPGDKVAALESVLNDPDRHGRVAYVGDGINDAPVLARADVGIAMGALGSDAAIEAADVVLMEDDLGRLPEAIGSARRTRSIVRQNIALALGVKAAVLLLGALGLASMWAAVFADVGVAVLAILNAMRTLR